MPLALAPKKTYTIDDIYALPDGKRAELVDGQIQDISVICDKSKLTDQGCFGAPDWIIEIVSPGSRRMDYFTKLFKYRTSGVREYWIVDPDRKRITLYDFESEDTQDYSFSESVKAGIYDDLFINFSEIAELLNI